MPTKGKLTAAQSRSRPNKARAVVPTQVIEPSISFEVTADNINIRFASAASAPEALALLGDGILFATAAVVQGDDATAVLPMPAWQLARLLQIASVPGGEILATLHTDGRRNVDWLGWAFVGRQIQGSFRLAGDLAPAPALMPLQVIEHDCAVATTFARPGADGTWTFRAELPHLPHAQHPLVFTPRVAGLDLSNPLTITHANFGVAGHVDPTESPFVHGWAIDLNKPDQPMSVDVTINGGPRHRILADIHRADITALGLNDGRSGFKLPFPRGLPRGVPLQVAVTLAGTPTHLVGSPYHLPPQPAFTGYFDALEGPFAGGWLVNMAEPETPLRVEAVCNGIVIGSGLADLYRGDVEKAGMPTARCGFRFLLERPLAELFDRNIWLRVVGTEEVLAGSPRQISQNGNIVRFLTRTAAISTPALQRLVRRVSHQTAGFGISIVMPIYNPRRDWLLQAINSVLGQWSPHWELICVDDGSTAPHVRQILEAAAKHDSRIRYMRAPHNQGIARTTNFGLRAASFPYVAFMDHDDTIEPDAVQKLAMAAKTTAADLLYSDEAITTDDIGSIIEVRARPAFSYDYYLSHPYFVHMICVRTEIAKRLGGWDESLPISADVDFMLRVIEASKVVTHVPGVLYRWRTHGGSAGHERKAEVTDTMVGILNRHLNRRGLAATAQPGLRYNEYRIDWPDDGGEVLIIIPTRNRVDLLKACIDSIERTSPNEAYRIVVIDHQSTDKLTTRYLKKIAARHTVMPYSGIFNYALMNNLAVKTHGGNARYLLLLNNDVEAIQPGWIARLRSLAARPEVGAVGPLLLYGDDRVQHAGVIVGFSGAADHAMKFQDAYIGDRDVRQGKGDRHPGYNCNLTTVRDYSAVTAACLMVSRRAWDAVGGFDEGFVIGFNDTDLCLRIREAGYKVLYDGFTVLYHYESATRTQSAEVDHPGDDTRLRTLWTRYFTRGDPFYNPLLAPRGTDHTLRHEAGCKGRMQAREVVLKGQGNRVISPKQVGNTKRVRSREPA